MNTAYFRFYEELNDFLPVHKRKVRFTFSFQDNPSIGNVIDQFGVPLGMVDLILVNQKPKGFDYKILDGDSISAYPEFERLDISPIVKIPGRPLRNPGFICDVNAGKLAKYLRMLGFDTLFFSSYEIEVLIRISKQEKRIILSRSYNLIRKEHVNRAVWLRSADSLEQVKQIIQTLDLQNKILPLTRCLRCNGTLKPVGKNEILHQLQRKTATYFDEFYTCSECGKIYWKGSHYSNMMEYIRNNMLSENSKE